MAMGRLVGTGWGTGCPRNRGTETGKTWHGRGAEGDGEGIRMGRCTLVKHDRLTVQMLHLALAVGRNSGPGRERKGEELQVQLQCYCAVPAV